MMSIYLQKSPADALNVVARIIVTAPIKKKEKRIIVIVKSIETLKKSREFIINGVPLMKKSMMTSNSLVNVAWAERGFHFDRPNFGNWFAGQIGKGGRVKVWKYFSTFLNSKSQTHRERPSRQKDSLLCFLLFVAYILFE